MGSPLEGFLPLFLIIGAWTSGPLILLTWTAVLGLQGDYFACFVVPSYLVLYGLPSRYFKLGWWLATTAASCSSVARLGFAMSVWIIAGPLILDVQVPAWEGFITWMDKTMKFKSFFRHCQLGGAVDKIKGDKTVFAFHPHGAVSIGFTVNGLFDSDFVARSKKLSFLIDGTLRYGNPLFRMLCEIYGTEQHDLRSAAKETMHELMSSGRNIALTLGGFEEATVCEMGKDRVVVRSRKGIIKYCLQYGYRIHPIYTFGEDETYHFARGGTKLRLKLNTFKIPTAAFFGNPFLWFMPLKSARLRTYVGEAIEFPKIDNPTKEDIDKWHKAYVEGLEALFNAKKVEAGRPDAKLELF